jgi:hypothetical protein
MFCAFGFDFKRELELQSWYGAVVALGRLSWIESVAEENFEACEDSFHRLGQGPSPQPIQSGVSSLFSRLCNFFHQREHKQRAGDTETEAESTPLKANIDFHLL